MKKCGAMQDVGIKALAIMKNKNADVQRRSGLGTDWKIKNNPASPFPFLQRRY